MTVLKDPRPVPVPPRAKATVSPPVVRSLPKESSACRVMVSVLPEATLADDKAIADVAKVAVPGVTAIVGEPDVIVWPSIVAVMVLPPSTVPVNVAVYVPLPLSVTELNEPCAVPVPPRANTTVDPPIGMFTPSESFACRVTAIEPPDCKLVGVTEIVEVAGSTGGT